MIKIKRIGPFDDGLKKLYVQNERLGKTVKEAILRFQRNPADTRLQNHRLTGQLKGKWAFSVAPDVRIVYEWKGKNVVRFLAIGTHKQVYPGSK